MTEAPVVVDGSALLGRARKAWGPFRHGGMTGVGLSGLRRRTPAGWTFGALAAHVAAWHLLTAERLERFAETGEPTPPPDDVDAFNADVARRAEGRLPTEIIDELDRSWQRIEAVVPRLTGEQVAASDGWAEAVIAGNTYDHYEEHRGELRSARPRTVDDLLGRFDADWRVLRDAVATLERDGRLGEPVSDTWQLRDVVAHSCGWLVEAVRTLPEFLAGHPIDYTGDDIQRHNDAAVSVRRGRADPELVAELDSAAAELRSAIANLRNEDVENPRTLGLIAWCSYLHWDEHLAQLGAEV